MASSTGLALALEQGVGRDRGAHLDEVHAAVAAVALGQDLADAGDRGVVVALRIVRQQLAHHQPPLGRARDDVGEGAAAVDREGPGGAHRPTA